jgi:hypothetical protein
LISCVSKKLGFRAKAQELYISPLFRLNLAYARRIHPDAIFIISAKYGLLDLDEEIEAYDVTLNDMSAREIREWARNVLDELGKRVDLLNDHFIFLAGHNYRKHLIQNMVSYEIPLERLPIGKQLQYLKRHLHE